MTAEPSAAQRAAIEAPLGPVLVVAGPGAGKTFCLIGRIGWLIHERGLAPSRICTVTFTNKAAEEIAERLHESLGARADEVHRGTLHALCVEVLREHGERIGIPKGFGIADEAYQEHLLRQLHVRRDRLGQLLTLFSRRRLQGYTLSHKDEELFQRYLASLRRRDVLDFDELIARTADVFRRHPDVAESVAARWDYVLVDEFQDLDPTQYAIVKALVEPHHNLFVVGDEEQSIFSWRGADPGVLRTYATEFEITDPLVLDHNRRCSRQIFESARRLLQGEPGLFEKRLRADRDSVYEVTAVAFEDDEEEAAWLMAAVSADRAGSELAWGDFALLYRTHEVGNALEGAFVRAGIPCRLARGRALQDDPVVRYVVAALRLMQQPDDPLLVEAFADIVLPEQLVQRIGLAAPEGGDAFLAALQTFARSNPRDDPDTKKAWRFVYHVENLRAMYRAHDSLTGLTDELLSVRVGPYANPLEERHDELTDPADNPEVVELADALAGAMHARRRVWVDGGGGVAIALRGMLLAAGVTLVAYRTAAHAVTADDVLVQTDPLTVFKALQLAHSRGFGAEYSDFVAFDIETTDKDSDTCEIVEIGAVRVRGGEVVDRFSSLVRPAVPISPVATREAHGLRDEDVADAPAFTDVWESFRAFVGTDLLVAHNGHWFDVPVLKRMAAGLAGVDDLLFYDSLILARSLHRSGASLEGLAHRFGVDMGRAHRALDDALTLARVFTELGRRRLVRARKAALVNLLQYLGLGLALDTHADLSPEGRLLFELSQVHVLGRFGESLEFYAAERDRLDDRAAPPLERVIELMGGRALMERLRSERTAEQRYPEAYSRLRALIDEARGQPLDGAVGQLLDRVALSTSDGAEADPHRVNLLTLHATKGLEFSRVFVVGVEDFQLPGYYQTIDQRTDEIDEARRLLYVGMTRARDRLVLTRVGRRRGKDAGGSRFLTEMGLRPAPAAPAASLAGHVASGTE